MALPWFKFYGVEYLADPKMLALTSSERSCWLTLLCLACASESNGIIKYVTEERLMLQSGLNFQYEEWEQTEGILKKLEKLEMITISNEIITIINWNKRQETSLTNAERQARFREKQKQSNEKSNTKITLDKIREDKISYSLALGITFWNKRIAWPADTTIPKNSTVQKKLLPQCRKETPSLEKAWEKINPSQEDWELAVKNYVVEIANRIPDDGYALHRFSMFDFIKQSNGYSKFLNR